MTTDLGELYAAARNRITDLVMSSPAESLDQPCPATPAWSVRDCVAHVRGIAEDVRTGNLDGVASEPWTAAQVARYRGVPIEVVLEGWAADAVGFEQFLSSPDGGSGSRAVVDLHAHELDVRGALRRGAPVPEPFATWALPLLVQPLLAAADASGMPALRIETDEGDRYGSDDASVRLRVSRFELFRAVMGRRSAAQVAAFGWGGADATPYLDHFFVFPPRELDLVEPSA